MNTKEPIFKNKEYYESERTSRAYELGRAKCKEKALTILEEYKNIPAYTYLKNALKKGL